MAKTKKITKGKKGGAAIIGSTASIAMAGAAIGAAAAVALGNEARRKKILQSAAILKNQAMGIIDDYSQEKDGFRKTAYKTLDKAQKKIEGKAARGRKRSRS